MSEHTVRPEVKLIGYTIKTAITIEGLLMRIVFFSNAEQFNNTEEPEHMKLKRVTFGEKAQRVRKILTQYHPDLCHKYKDTLFEVDKFVTFRNRVAHCPITWKDGKPENFIFWDVKEDQSKFEYLKPIEHNWADTLQYLSDMLKMVKHSLQELVLEVQNRLKDSHPELHAVLMKESNSSQAKQNEH